MTDPRRAALAEAAAHLNRDELLRAAEHSPPARRAMLQRAADALGAADPGAALAGLLNDWTASGMPRDLGRGVAAARGALLAHRVRLEGLRNQGARISQTRAQLLDALRGAVGEAKGDDVLLARIEEALALTESLPTDDELSALLDNMAGVIARLGEALDAASAGTPPPDLTAMVEGLEQQLADLLTRADPAPAVNLLQDLAELAFERGAPFAGAATFAAAEAVTGLQGKAHPDARRLWRRSLDLALKGGDVERAWAAGKPVQAEALADGDWSRVAVVAHRVADLTPTNDPRRFIARMEECLALARLPKFTDDARQIALGVLREAGPTPPSQQARLWLMAGQLLEQLADPVEARAHLRHALTLAKDGPADVLGRAALHLGRLEEAAGHKHQAHQALELAWRVAGTTGDWGLFNAAAPAWIEHLRARGDVDTARAALTQALTLADTTPYGPMFRVEAQRRWGAELS